MFGQAPPNYWVALMLYTTDRRMPIDNDDTEQLMKRMGRAIHATLFHMSSFKTRRSYPANDSGRWRNSFQAR